MNNVVETMTPREDRIAGVLLGTALGDALGLPMEGLGASAIAADFEAPVTRFHLLGRTGFVSDDTEQAVLTAEAVIAGRGDPDKIVRCFRRALRAWFLRLPFGIGFSTLRACLRLCVGLANSGVRSAGNGAAMRAPIIGAAMADEPFARRYIARQLALITHTDQRAVEGAVFVAELAAECMQAEIEQDRIAMIARAAHVVSHPELRDAIVTACELATAEVPTADAVARLGTSGYVVHTIGFVSYCFAITTGSPLASIQRAISGGGDTDTNAAIVGAWVGALHGASSLPPDLVNQIHDGPFGPTHLRRTATALAGRGPAPRWSCTGAMSRNLALYPVVLGHGLLRLARAVLGRSRTGGGTGER
jgi:ADP-ribosylglycohydrolase